MSDRHILYSTAFLRALATPLLVGAGMKIGYDLLLYRSFRDLKPPEERAAG